MNKLLIVLSVLICTSVLAGQTVTAFKSGEKLTGNTKQCFYKWGGNKYTKTVKGYQLCPMSIKVQL